MATQPIIHTFKEVNKGKYRSTRHFELVEVQNGQTQLSEKINLSFDRHYAISSPEYWLKIRKNGKWSRCVTGLFKTVRKGIFKGDYNQKKNLLLFDYPDQSETIRVFFFPNFFTRDINQVMHYIKN